MGTNETPKNNAASEQQPAPARVINLNAARNKREAEKQAEQTVHLSEEDGTAFLKHLMHESDGQPKTREYNVFLASIKALKDSTPGDVMLKFAAVYTPEKRIEYQFSFVPKETK